MINISNLICKDNPQWPQAGAARPRPPTGAPVTVGRGERSLRSRIGNVLVMASWVLIDRLTSIPRRLCDRLFQMNDAEAYWRDWQIIKVHGGLGRRYRDPRFDTLASCPRCLGAAVDARANGAAGAPCLPCLGTGRVAVGTGCTADDGAS